MLTHDGVDLPYRTDDLPVLDPGTRIDVKDDARLLAVGPFGHDPGLHASERSQLRAWRDRALAAPGAPEGCGEAWSALAALAALAPYATAFTSSTLDELAEAFADAPTPDRTPLAELLAGTDAHALVVGLFDLAPSPRDLTVLEGCAALGARLGVAFVFGASAELCDALAEDALPGPLAERLARLRGEHEARWICLVPGAVFVPGSPGGCPGSLALALPLAATLGGSGDIANFIGLETGGALPPDAACTAIAESTDAWLRRAESGLASVVRAPDGRVYFPGAPTLARPPQPARDWSLGATTWAARAPWVSPTELGRRLETQLPWVLLGGVFVRAARVAWRELGANATAEDFRKRFEPWFSQHHATHGAVVSAKVRCRRPISERSRVELGPAGQIAFSLCLHAVGARPSLTVSAAGLLPGGAAAPAPPGATARAISAAEAELLAAVHAAPDDDDAARLAYADWLLARGEPRGEFIALQLRRARGQSAPGEFGRERALLSVHAAEWLGPLARVAAGRAEAGRAGAGWAEAGWAEAGWAEAGRAGAGWQQPVGWPREGATDLGVAFERGFPERLALGGPRWLYDVVGEAAWATLRALDLAWAWAPADTLALVTQPALRRLRELHDLVEPVLLRLADEPPLAVERLSLHDPRDTRGGTRELLARFPALRRVELRSWRPEVAAALERFAPPQLDELVLATSGDGLRPALESAGRSSVRRFVFARRARDGHFELAFTRDEAGKLAALTVESCAGRTVELATETLEALPVDLVSRAAVRGSELVFPPRLRHALLRFG